jgi:ankyrin repeat protein
VPLPVVKLLLGCNPRSAGIPDSQQYLPLHHACEMGSNLELIQTLVEACPESTRALTRKQDSALSLACTSNKSASTVKLLLNANRDVLTQKNDYGFCPLHCVCRTHQPRMGIVKALVEACPESIFLQTHSGETPFHLASSNTGAFVGVLQVLAQTQARLRSSSINNNNDNNGSESAAEAISLSASAFASAAASKQAALSNEGGLLEETTTAESDTDAYLAKREAAGILHRHPFILDLLDPSSPHDHGDGTDNNIRRSPSFVRRTVTTNKMGNTPRK